MSTGVAAASSRWGMLGVVAVSVTAATKVAVQ
jgi:hypothetical protein